jgi:C4-dicarboxylate-specific signal transduction histidine kinase
METEIAVVLIAGCFTLLANLFVIAWGVRQIQLSRKQTEDLAKLTTQLNFRLEKLNRELDQSIYRLNRARELVSDIHRVYYNLSIPQSGVVIASKVTALGEVSGSVRIELAIYVAELIGIGAAVGDSSLIALINDMKNLTEKETIKSIEVIFELICELHTRIYELLDHSTK